VDVRRETKDDRSAAMPTSSAARRATPRPSHAARAALLLAAFAACGTTSYPTPTAECKTDDECAIDDVARDCCGYLCGPSPPWVAIDTKSRSAIIEARRKRCEGKRLDCPVASCTAPPQCRATPRAACQAGRCVAQLDLTEECGKGACAAECGAQPAAPPPGKEQACARALEDEWVSCCCRSMGAPDAICGQGRNHISDECRSPSPG
jgi:hypothetical protein